MARKPIELPPEVARAFVRDMHAFFAAGGTGVDRRGFYSSTMAARCGSPT
jgi:hypothetical protein